MNENIQPYNALTEEDKKIITKWCMSYGGAEPSNLSYVLRYWNKNKKSFFKLFDNKLRIKIKVVANNFDNKVFYNRMEEVYSPFCFRTIDDIKHFKSINKTEPINRFIYELVKSLEFLYEKNKINKQDLRAISSYINYPSVLSGKVVYSKHIFFNDDKKLVIEKNMKTMRCIRKIIEFFNLQEMLPFFNKWKDELSVICSDKTVNTNLVLSIHPLDFLTLSDNNSGWTSCLRWMDGGGGYSAGAIEMLNSNLAIVAYLENESRDFIFCNKKIPNKMWRSLVFMNKNIILVGKNYPFKSCLVEDKIIDILEQLAYDKFNWKYKYHKEKYNDLINYYYCGNNYIKETLDRVSGRTKHKIFVYTGASMFNDFIENPSYDFVCSRNYVSNTLYLNLSGPLVCICCGDRIYEDSLAQSNKKICTHCSILHKCNNCYCTSFNLKVQRCYVYNCTDNRIVGKNICKNCLKEYLYNKELDIYIKKDEVFNFLNKEKNFITIRVAKESTKTSKKYYIHEVLFLYYKTYLEKITSEDGFVIDNIFVTDNIFLIRKLEELEKFKFIFT